MSTIIGMTRDDPFGSRTSGQFVDGIEFLELDTSMIDSPEYTGIDELN